MFNRGGRGRWGYGSSQTSHVHSCTTGMFWYGAGVLPKTPFNVQPDSSGRFYNRFEIHGRMMSQQRVEKLRYFRDRRTMIGFVSRFVWGFCPTDVFQEGMVFRTPVRPPIGRNPERFAIGCIVCARYIYRAEYSDADVLKCDECMGLLESQ
jgi:hypothetical protein